MNLNEACNNLQIVDFNDEISEAMLKTQYRKMSLLYHPDKNRSDSSIKKFQEIHDSYEFLGKYLGYIDEDYYFDEYTSGCECEPKYLWNLLHYKEKFLDLLDASFGDEMISQIKEIILNKFLFVNSQVDKKKLVKMCDFIIKNKKKYDISDDFLYSVEKLLNYLGATECNK
jgi:hypothetical protein